MLQEINKLEMPEQNIKLEGSKIVEDDESYSKYAIGEPSGSENNKVLGVKWDSDADQIKLELTHVVEYSKSLPPSKRSVLSIAAKIFDPLGLLSLYTVNLKSFFQELCINKVDWDDELQGSYRQRFYCLLSELEKLPSIQINRCLFKEGKTVESIEIHGFSDASERAYAAVVYLRVLYKSGEVEVRFISSKAKVAPIKKQSIPRLELLGACLLAKLVYTIREILTSELKGKKLQTFYWVDSMSVLCWIKNVKPWSQYVRNRVSDILKVSIRQQWFHCPGNINPADLPSRGIFNNFSGNSLWWEGPAFLKLNPKYWPKSPAEKELETDVSMREKLKSDPNIVHAMLTTDTSSKPRVHEIIDITRFSTKNKLLHTIAWVLRFINNSKIARANGSIVKDNNVSANEVDNAEHILIKSIQNEAFAHEISYLSRKSNNKPPLYVSQLNLYLDKEGILRCRTRIGKATISELSKTPILLPSKNWYSELLVYDCHEKVFHDGIGETLHILRQKYWVLRGREKVKRVIRRCTVCKKLEGLPYKTVFCPELPKCRFDEGPPFSNVGMDFAGPLIVSDMPNNKCYICLFTCASTRAVHLELVETLDVESFIRAFRRFCARRGLPSRILSDNAKTFKSAAKEVKTLLRSPRFNEHFSCKGVQWEFIIERAPWQGGMWERLIRSTKRCLRKNVGRALLKFAELRTVLVEIENVINSRPLTYIYDDEEGVNYPLTPSQLINGRNLAMLPNDGHYEIVSTHESLSKRARYHRKVLSHFIKKWQREYLLNLLEAHRPKGANKEPSINVGDVVLLRDEQTKRNFWKLCRVVELLESKDGSVRAAKVQVGSSSGGKKVLRRALNFLVPLEIPCDSFTDHCNEKLLPSQTQALAQLPNQLAEQRSQATAQTPLNPSRRSRRNAALIGEMRRRDGNLT